MIRVRFLGTAAARPTVARNVSAISVQRGGESILWDCGEGTQRQIMRYGTGFSFCHIFITHTHADHFLGLPGLLRTMGLQGREEGMTIYGPPGSERILKSTVHLGVERLTFPVEIKGIDVGETVDFGDWSVRAYAADHGVAALGYALVEEERLGRFDIDLARKLGIPEGPLFGRLHRGESVEVNGKVIGPEEVVGPPRPGRTVVYSGDTRPCNETICAAQGADLLIHEATFGAAEGRRALETRHSTAAEAARVAADAGAERLILTHISARYSEIPKILEGEARAVFPGSSVASDGMRLEIPYRE